MFFVDNTVKGFNDLKEKTTMDFFIGSNERNGLKKVC